MVGAERRQAVVARERGLEFEICGGVGGVEVERRKVMAYGGRGSRSVLWCWGTMLRAGCVCVQIHMV